jgi:hypothetical protein
MISLGFLFSLVRCRVGDVCDCETESMPGKYSATAVRLHLPSTIGEEIRRGLLCTVARSTGVIISN